jgi:hypothetical protein
MYAEEIEECRRRIMLGNALFSLANHNPDFRMVFTQGLLHDEVLKRALNINADESGTVEFLKAVTAFKKYIDKIRAEAEQASVDLANYMNLIQDAR